MNPLKIPNTCRGVRSHFSEYLDVLASGHTMHRVAIHLRDCPACAHDFAAWRATQDSLASIAILRKPPVPADLSLKLRLAISHERARRSVRLIDTIALKWENAVRPLAIQFSAGFATAVALVGTVGLLLGTVAAPTAVMANDEPLAAISTPRYLYSAERSRPLVTAQNATIVIEADIDAQGRVYDYTIVSGPQSDDPAVRTQVRDRLLLSVFEPARVFGTAVRGRVLVTYSGVSLRR